MPPTTGLPDRSDRDIDGDQNGTADGTAGAILSRGGAFIQARAEIEGRNRCRGPKSVSPQDFGTVASQE
jgi:hypothetical protein